MKRETTIGCLNPLESGQSFEYNHGEVDSGPRRSSQSPRIGAVIRMSMSWTTRSRGIERLNPLESGQSFESIHAILDGPASHGVSQSPRIGAVIRIKEALRRLRRFRELSQSPRIGAVIRMDPRSGWSRHCPLVSIPSNRGSHSNKPRRPNQSREEMSQSPRIGAVIRITRNGISSPRRKVSIPSNRGSHSNV